VIRNDRFHCLKEKKELILCGGDGDKRAASITFPTISVTILDRGGGGGKLTLRVRKFNLRRRQVRKIGKTVLNAGFSSFSVFTPPKYWFRKYFICPSSPPSRQVTPTVATSCTPCNAGSCATHNYPIRHARCPLHASRGQTSCLLARNQFVSCSP
jgi:hypothetical protein